eukprot:CAMPEP_0197433258 /NCGR_PEP_ID=MMETSP1175-20131217/1182_1 /TAXON_ID=1003142 /ORGANISM="Triceratium dubium, Strain CCMP147" /LENGTH=211 /DNA_ID=CAMNT_0042961579 /DNA_START=364 /DNA_END=999 /DNA_ORIENTATION=+
MKNGGGAEEPDAEIRPSKPHVRLELDSYLERLQRKRRILNNLDSSGANILNEIGNVHFRRGWLDHALESYQEALDAIISDTEVRGYNRMEALLTGITQNIAVVLYLMGKFEESKCVFAFSLFLQNLHVTRRAPHYNHDKRTDVMKTIACMYDTHINRGEYAEANRIHCAAREIRKAAFDLKARKQSQQSLGAFVLMLCRRTWLSVEMCKDE